MTEPNGRGRVSAGILLFRLGPDGLHILLGHPGGPYFSDRDAGIWSIPKGEAEEGEELWAVACREFGEETGHAIGSGVQPLDLGHVRQAGGKRVFAWAVEGDLDPAQAWSNTFEMAWPPRSSIVITVPELDRVAWFSPDAARRAMNPAQIDFVDRLLDALGERLAEADGPAREGPDPTPGDRAVG